MIEAGCLIALLIAGLVYGLVLVFEDAFSTEFDEVTEARCKQCINYPICSDHGYKYMCEDYMTEEMLKRKGVEK